jgi:hypothetical protein
VASTKGCHVADGLLSPLRWPPIPSCAAHPTCHPWIWPGDGRPGTAPDQGELRKDRRRPPPPAAAPVALELLGGLSKFRLSSTAPARQQAAQARARQPPATDSGASRTAEVRSARAACRHRPEAGPAALASSRSPPSPDRMGGSTPAGLLLALLVLAAVPLAAARRIRQPLRAIQAQGFALPGNLGRP